MNTDFLPPLFTTQGVAHTTSGLLPQAHTHTIHKHTHMGGQNCGLQVQQVHTRIQNGMIVGLPLLLGCKVTTA